MAAVLLALLGTCAMADPNGEVIIGQQVILRIRYPAGGMSIEARVDNITSRLNRLLGSKSFDLSLITVRRYGNDYGIMYGDNLVVTADAKTAVYNKTTTEALAKIWAENLKKVIPLAKAVLP